MVDVILREYSGYTYGTLMHDIEEFEEFLGLALASISARNEIQEEEQTGGKLHDSDIGTKRGERWANSRSNQSKRNISGAHAALNSKFPGML